MNSLHVALLIWLFIGTFNIIFYEKNVPKIHYVCMFVALIVSYIGQLT